MGTLFVDNIKHESAQGSGTITIGASGETVALASGASASGNFGNLVLLNTVTTTDATTTNIDFDSTYITSTYKNYLVLANVKPATDNVQLRIRFFVSGSIKSGASDYGVGTRDEGGGGTNDNDISYLLGSQTAQGNATGEGTSGNYYFFNLTSSTFPSQMTFTASGMNSSHLHNLVMGGGAANYELANDGIRFFYSSGNFASGSEISLYGVKS